MKPLYFAFLVFLCFSSKAQVNVLGVDTLQKTGSLNNRINLVILGDGYTAAETPQFISNATNSYTYLLNQPPFSYYKNYFNVFAIKCVSPQSGISHPGNATDVQEPQFATSNITNNFSTTFDSYNIHRLVVPMNQSPIYNVLTNYFPNYDQVLVVANSSNYGGSGGTFATATTHTSSNEIMAHEIGHSFAGLADEYWAGTQYAGEKPNMTGNSNTSTIKWSQWLGINSTGIYPYGSSAPLSNWYKPHQNCKMQYLNSPFCSVCEQTIIEKIHGLVSPIDSYLPANSSTLSVSTGSTQIFKSTLVYPNPNTLKTHWKLNSNVLAKNTSSISLSNALLNQGINTLLFTVIDTTQFTKDLNHITLHTSSVLWSLQLLPTGVEKIVNEMELNFFPNPANDYLNIRYKLNNQSTILFNILNSEGKIVVKESAQNFSEGNYIKQIDVSALKNGLYFLSININNKIINHQLIISK